MTAKHFTVARLLRADARQWWYHAQLRRQGNAAEARRREAESVRSSIAHIRLAHKNGGFLMIGRGGNTLHLGADGLSSAIRVSGLSHEACAALLAAGVRAIDTTTIPNDRIVEVGVRWPMLTVDSTPYRQPGEWRGAVPLAEAGPLDDVRVSEAAYRYAAVGATLSNFPQCDSCETFASLIALPDGRYRCDDCNTRTGEARDAALWADAEYPFTDNY
jgi:hypothetical protein